MNSCLVSDSSMHGQIYRGISKNVYCKAVIVVGSGKMQVQNTRLHSCHCTSATHNVWDHVSVGMSGTNSPFLLTEDMSPTPDSEMRSQQSSRHGLGAQWLASREGQVRLKCAVSNALMNKCTTYSVIRCSFILIYPICSVPIMVVISILMLF